MGGRSSRSSASNPFRKERIQAGCVALMIQLYYTDVSPFFSLDMESIASACFHKLSAERARKTLRFRRTEDKVRSLFSELLLNHALLENGAVDSFFGLGSKLKIGTHGKPYIEGDTNAAFNISHSGKYVVLAYASSCVGVDIEELIRFSSAKSILNSFSSQEKRRLEMYPACQRTEQITRFWTLKESYIKYLGCGFFLSFSEFSLGKLIDGSDPDRTVRSACDVEDKGPVFFHTQKLDPGYYLSVCTAKEEPISLIHVPAESLWYHFLFEQTQA